VLGILGLVLCQILGPVAWYMGNAAMREIDAAGGYYRNRSQVQAGRICGIVASVLLGLSVVFGLFFLLLVLVSGTAASNG